MITATAEIVVEAGPQHIWNQLIQNQGWEGLFPGDIGWPDGRPDRFDEGAQFRQRLGQFGIYDTVTTTVVENTFPTRFVVRSAGNYGADCQLAIALEPTPNGHTSIRIDIAIIGALVRPVSTLARMGLKRGLVKGMNDLKQHLVHRTQLNHINEGTT